nr:class I SAM-dependent methyltransferase [Candidatus Sigynarchaeota archaeon]
MAKKRPSNWDGGTDGNDRSDEAIDDEPESWEIEGNRPEDQYTHPAEYWTAEAIARLLKAKGQARIQHELAIKALNNLSAQFPGILEIEGSGPVAIDIGCGLGFASDVLVDAGFTAVGIDIINDMLLLSSKREAVAENGKRGRYHRVLASATSMPLRSGVFDIATSISALQWLNTAGAMQSFASELDRVASPRCAITFQHYPRSSDQMMELGTTIKQHGFEGGILVENVKNPRKRKIFLLARKRAEPTS